MSKSKLKNTTYSIHQLIKPLKGYSYASKADMKHMLNRCVKDLHALGYKISHINGLKPKHVFALVEHWKSQDKNPATIKNYMAKLRKVSVLLDKPQLVKGNNDAYQIARRSYAPSQNKAIHHVDWSKCTDPFIKLSLEAQQLFGLRREESMKLVLSEAWQGEQLNIKPSWTKGGIGRTLLITNNEQRTWLQQTSRMVAKGQSFIPKERSYRQHLSRYQAQTQQMGLSKCHGLRHAYAQRRYHELTKAFDPSKKGLICPIAGGIPARQLKGVLRQIDRQARDIISRELGHSRIAIVKIYCG